MEFYRQCQLQKGTTTTTSWIPERYAKKTMILALKNDRDEWDDGWRVTEIGTTRLPENVVVAQERGFKDFSYHMNKFGNKQRKGLE